MSNYLNDLLAMTVMLERAGYQLKTVETGFELEQREYMVKMGDEGHYMLWLGQGEVGDLHCVSVFAFDRKTHKFVLHGSNHFVK